jgi:hypothetical protein
VFCRGEARSRRLALAATITECTETIREKGVRGLNAAGNVEIGSTEDDNEQVEKTSRGTLRRSDKLYRECSRVTVVGRRAFSLASRSKSEDEPAVGSIWGSSAISIGM